MCKSQYYTMESFININDDKNNFITIFQNELEIPIQKNNHPNIIYEIMYNTFLIIIVISLIVIFNLTNFEIKKPKYAKIVPI